MCATLTAGLLFVSYVSIDSPFLCTVVAAVGVAVIVALVGLVGPLSDLFVHGDVIVLMDLIVLMVLMVLNGCFAFQTDIFS